MPPRKGLPRHVMDASSGVALVFPDTLSLVLRTEDTDATSVTFTLTASLEASKDDLAHFQIAREIRLTDLRFSLSAPQDDDVISFDFVRSDETAKGSVILVVRSSAALRIKTALATDPGFLSPTYRGNSEEYSAIVSVASARLDDNQVSEVNSIASNQGFAQAILKLVSHVNSASDTPKYSLALVNEGLAENGELWLSGDSPNRRWNLRLPMPLPGIAIKEILPKVDRVSGTHKEMVVRWSE